MLQDPASSQLQSHPRRPLAPQSASLRHDGLSPASSACSRKAQAAQDDEIQKSIFAWRASPVHRSLEESNESADVPAETWFDRSNNNIGSRLGPPFVDSKDNKIACCYCCAIAD